VESRVKHSHDPAVPYRPTGRNLPQPGHNARVAAKSGSTCLVGNTRNLKPVSPRQEPDHIALVENGDVWQRNVRDGRSTRSIRASLKSPLHRRTAGPNRRRCLAAGYLHLDRVELGLAGGHRDVSGPPSDSAKHSEVISTPSTRRGEGI
jgi:hypothetical protein